MAIRRVVVYGAGAVGGYLGGKLARTGSDLDVTLIGRSQMVEAVRARGLIVRDGDQEEITHPRAMTSSGDLSPCDLVVLAVRTYDVEASIPDVKRLIGQDGLVLAMQNGVGTEEMLAGALGRDRVLAGTITVSEGMEEPGVVTRYSRSGGMALSTMSGGLVPEWVVEAIRGMGLPTVLVDDYRSLRWSKLLLNMIAAPVGAILDIDVAQLARNPELFRVDQLAFREAGRVMDTARIRAVELPGYPVPLARLAMRLPRALAQPLIGPRIIGSRQGRSPGMRADLKRGKTEVDWYNGAVARQAQALGLAAPVNAALTNLTHTLADHPDQRERFRGKPDALVAWMRQKGIRRL